MDFLIFLIDGVYDVEVIEVGVVWLTRHHLKHPRSVFHRKGKS